MTQKMNEEFIKFILQNASFEEAVFKISEAITNRDKKIKELEIYIKCFEDSSGYI